MIEHDRHGLAISGNNRIREIIIRVFLDKDGELDRRARKLKARRHHLPSDLVWTIGGGVDIGDGTGLT